MPDRRVTPRDRDDAAPPAPLPDLPLCIPLPAGWFDDPGYRLAPYGYVGCEGLPAQFGVLGTCLRAGELLAMSYEGCFAHAYFGPPHSGKSYLEGVHLESALSPNRYQNRLLRPLCGVALSYGRHAGGGRAAEQLSARLPNHDQAEVRRLVHGHGTLPQGIEDVLALVPRRSLARTRAEHPHCEVLPLAFSCPELGTGGLQSLMALDEGEGEGSLLAAEIADLLGALPAGFGHSDLRAAIEAYPFRDERLRRLVRRRAELASELVCDKADLRALVRPGRLIVVDIRDSWLAQAQAMRIFQVLLDVLLFGPAPLPCGLLLSIDEAHKLLAHRALRRRIEHVIRERRHLGASVILLSQDPLEVPHSTLAELDGVGLFSTASVRSLRHLARDIEPFGDVRPRDLAALRAGQVLLWSRRYFTPYQPGELDGKLVRVQVRPRMSHHGGVTRGAVP